MFWKSPRPAKATDQARRALGLAPEVVAQGEEAIGKALAVADTPPPPPPAPSSPLPSSPAGHLSFAARMTAQMDADEAALLASIEDEKEAHTRAITALEGKLADTRKTRAFYATAPDFLAPEPPPEQEAAPKPARKKRVRGHTAAEAERSHKPEGQGATNE